MARELSEARYISVARQLTEARYISMAKQLSEARYISMARQLSMVQRWWRSSSTSMTLSSIRQAIFTTGWIGVSAATH